MVTGDIEIQIAITVIIAKKHCRLCQAIAWFRPAPCRPPVKVPLPLLWLEKIPANGVIRMSTFPSVVASRPHSRLCPK